jgi:hypothetical protein
MSKQGVYKVNEKNMKLINKLIESVFNDFRTYPVGNRFWVGDKAKQVEVEEQARGLWIL